MNNILVLREQAIKIILAENNPSLSLIQVRLKLSLNDAIFVMDDLVSIGFISDYKTANARITNPNILYTTNTLPTSVSFTDSMDGHSFEYFCADILRYNGYSAVQVTSGSGDFGVDILCKKNNYSYAIQCKCYSNNVGNKSVQEVFSGKAFYKCDFAIVITNSYFTSAAEETARLTDVHLWDRGRLNELYRIACANGYKYHS